MFTQIGLDNMWREAKSGMFFYSADVQIISDSGYERCIKIYLHFERRFAFFSSKRSPLQLNQPFSLWVRSSQWEHVLPMVEPKRKVNDLAYVL
jgi:hypothetical protein